ncbi:uncharacterized protein F5891DRAFT_1131121 [Suillus fuscotomentosus]|uniref:Uncharacterized protein n=1 Tax=Suillus fuscotomentosus TaxID=1912939 RepID=A0AAD4DTZ2_9AGAM|nr:uncharacterized protein F5891DRAFT_1131121 [Suillus fuscotomentosus]KAG1893905.1 hypothetical protein F5891DRAFT_1131121 [Suillus fuscotomentosus]
MAPKLNIDDQQAAAILANIWHIQNDADKRLWTAKAEAKHREAAEEEAQHQQALKAEQEAAIQEERKKNKAKYAPIKDMKSGEYCKLFYFTNSGLEEASCSTLTADDDALIMMHASDGLHKWVPAGTIRDPKAQVIKDENITWEQFNESTNDWPDDRINMHISFWSALQNHRWCHNFDAHKQRALLLYQAQQRAFHPCNLST